MMLRIKLKVDSLKLQLDDLEKQVDSLKVASVPIKYEVDRLKELGNIIFAEEKEIDRLTHGSKQLKQKDIQVGVESLEILKVRRPLRFNREPQEVWSKSGGITIYIFVYSYMGA